MDIFSWVQENQLKDLKCYNIYIIFIILTKQFEDYFGACQKDFLFKCMLTLVTYNVKPSIRIGQKSAYPPIILNKKSETPLESTQASSISNKIPFISKPSGLPIYMRAGTADWTKYFSMIVTIYILLKEIQLSSKGCKVVQNSSNWFKRV